MKLISCFKKRYRKFVVQKLMMWEKVK